MFLGDISFLAMQDKCAVCFIVADKIKGSDGTLCVDVIDNATHWINLAMQPCGCCSFSSRI